MAPVLAEALAGKTGPLIAYHGSPVKDAKIGWRCLRARAFPPTPEQLEGLPEPTTTAERRKDAVAALDVYVRRVLALAAAPVSPGYHPNALLGSAAGAAKSLKLLVGATGFEPVTPTMST